MCALLSLVKLRIGVMQPNCYPRPKSLERAARLSCSRHGQVRSTTVDLERHICRWPQDCYRSAVSSGVATIALPLQGVHVPTAQVVGKERDTILARRLWEAAQRSEDVVGIVGAAHVKVRTAGASWYS